MAIDARRLRQYLNRVDRWFDRSTLTREERVSRELGDDASPATARQALRRVLPVVRRVDRSAQLKLVAGSEALDGSGRATRWEFFFDLPRRRAKAALEWVLPWDVEADAPGPPVVQGVVRPFPAPGSVMLSMIDSGDLLYRQLNGRWRSEMRRRPALPLKFRDSDEVLRELREQGVDLATEEVALTAEAAAGEPPVWTGRTRRQEFRVPLMDPKGASR